MNTIETLRTFFGWCTVINVGLLLLTTVALLLLRGTVSRIHARLFGLNEEDLARAYFQYLAQFKIAVIVFSLVPYAALCVMTCASCCGE